MWYIGEEDDPIVGSNNANVNTVGDSMIMSDHHDNYEADDGSLHEGENTRWGDNTPIPCALSHSTLGSASFASVSLFASSSSLAQKMLHSPSSTVSLSRIKNNMSRPIARDIAKGMVSGAMLSFIFIASLLILTPESTAKWMQSIQNRMVRESSTRIRNDVAKTGNNPDAKKAPIRDVYHRATVPQVYHRNGTVKGMHSLSQRSKSNNNRRRLKASLSYGDLSDDDRGSMPVKYDNSDTDDVAPITIKPPKDPQLVIAGKMTVLDSPCNIAQLNLKTGEWSLQQRIQLSVYSSYSGGDVYSLIANHSIVTKNNAQEFSAGESNTEHVDEPHVMDKNFGGNLIVVGSFDTTYRNSQTTYCSVGKWDGSELSKIGEGLCNSALSRGMKITSAAISGPNDIYVGGSFQTQVWNGNAHQFVKIFNIAHYNAIDEVWLPLPSGQLTCSWCIVTVLALAWDSKREQLHVAGKFNAIDGANIPAGLAIYERKSGRLVAHPGGGLTLRNITEDGVGTAMQFDQENGVLYVMGSFERLTKTNELCAGLAAYEIESGAWTCLADPAHSVVPTGGGNMLLTPYGLLVAGKITNSSTWPYPSRPYTVAVLKATVKKKLSVVIEGTTKSETQDDDSYHDEVQQSKRHSYHDEVSEHGRLVESNGTTHEHNNKTGEGFFDGSKPKAEADHEYIWSWLPGFEGHGEPIHTLSNGFGNYVGTVFIGGNNFVSKWSYKTVNVKCNTTETKSTSSTKSRLASTTTDCKTFVPVTVDLSNHDVHGVVMAISQLEPPEPKKIIDEEPPRHPSVIGYTIIVYCVTLGAVIGMFLALMCNKSINQTIMSFLFDRDAHMKGISLDTLTYGHMQNTNVAEAYHRAMSNRFVKHPHLLTLIDPQEVILHRIIGEGTFGRVWSAKWGSSSVAVKEFVFAQAAVAGKSRQQQAIVEEIIGEAGMMAILRHPNVLQLFGCSLTAQAIWIVSELCSLGSLRQVLDDRERPLSLDSRLDLALQVAEGMAYLHAQDPPIIHRDLKSHNVFVAETFAETPMMKEKSDDSKKLLAWPLGGSRNSGTKKGLLGGKSGGSRSDSESGSGSSLPVKDKAPPRKARVNSIMNAKIGDWGSARATLAGSRTMTHGVGTACWMAPEVLKHARSSKYSDVYGFGIVLWELATRREVYEGLESTQIIAMVANDHLRPDVPPGCPWNNVMQKCWREVPEERPSFEEIVKELISLRPAVLKSNYTGEELRVPKWKSNSYQKGGPPLVAPGSGPGRRETG